jgi:outer membrane protein assembly factor BamB
MKRALLLSALLLSTNLIACSDGWFGDKDEKAPLKGDRISVLDYEKDLRPEEGVSTAAFTATGAQSNDGWPQAGGYPSHAMGNLELGASLKRAWSSSIGAGSRSRLPLTAQPIVMGESVFALDTDSELSAFDASSGNKRWSVSVRDPDEEDPVISGGIAGDAGVVYVTAGYDELVAVDATNGKVKWRAALTSPSRAAPTVVGNKVFVTTMSNSVLAINTADGKVEWEFAGIGQSTGLIGAASPAATNDLVIPAFSSGEIYALRTGNGSVTWSDSLANTTRLGGMTGLSDIRGLPVIDGGVVYAISYGGKMGAMDLNSGTRLWTKDITGAKTPWVIGNRIFLVTSDSQIVALDKEKGTVLWVSQLAKFKDKEDKTGPIIWSGPIFAGNRLMLFSSDGRIAEVNPETGTLVKEWGSGADVRVSPIVAGKTLYILGEDGDLSAYR